MAIYVTEKSGPLYGEVKISGAKNAVLPIMSAALLTDGECEINGVPDLLDVDVMSGLLEYLGSKITKNGPDKIIIKTDNIDTWEAPYELVTKMRASILVLGPLLARFGKARIALPGGCAIGERPIDMHIKGFEMMGAKIEKKHGFIEASTPKLKGTTIYFDLPSVGATENLIMGASLAEGITVIENAAKEPEIVDLANFINKMGGKVKGAGTDTIRIEGVENLTAVKHSIIPDRIETGTFMVAAAMTGGKLLIKNVVPNHVRPVIAKLVECGVDIEGSDDRLLISAEGKELASTNIKTFPYPGFPTDMQPQMMAFLTRTSGQSVVTETVFENRFMHVAELNKMGADIRINGRSVAIPGSAKLQGAKVSCTDLRAGAAMVLAGLVAEGITEISEIYHIERGYSDLAEKFRELGAKIKRIPENDNHGG